LAKAGYAITDLLLKESKMENSLLKPVPHYEALRFIEKFEKKLKSKARRIKSATKITLTEASLQAYIDLGLKSRYQFNELCENLRQRAEHFSVQESRVRCATNEKAKPNENYYAFSSKLDLESYSTLSPEILLVPKEFRTLRSKWVGYSDEDSSVELRVACFTDPEKIIDCHSAVLNNTVYVLNNERDLTLWFTYWGGGAVVREDLVVNHFYLSRWLKPYKNESGWS